MGVVITRSDHLGPVKVEALWYEKRRPGRQVRIEFIERQNGQGWGRAPGVYVLVRSVSAHNKRPQRHPSMISYSSFLARFSPVVA